MGPQILFLDAYDSFANNIVALITESIGAYVEIVRIDDCRYPSAASFTEYARQFDAIVAGPGPGTPENPADIGLITHLWTMEPPVPVLGICLGFQSLCLAFGASIPRLREPRHGIITPIIQRSLDGSSISTVDVTQYHSLRVDLGYSSQHESFDYDSSSSWVPSDKCPSLQPFAWIPDDVDNGWVLMGVKHANRPFWGVQYHPESICTSSVGADIVVEWWKSVQCLHKLNPCRQASLYTHSAEMSKDRNIGRIIDAATCQGLPSPPLTPRPQNVTKDTASAVVAAALLPRNPHGTVSWRTINHSRLQVDDVVEFLSTPKCEAVIFETPLATRRAKRVSNNGGHSIIACLHQRDVIKIQYYATSRRVEILRGDIIVFEDVVDDIWTWLEDIMHELESSSGDRKIPFWGGLVGYVTYEASLETIDILSSTTGHQRPDINFAYVSRSIVLDHDDGAIYIQSILDDDEAWLEELRENLSVYRRHIRQGLRSSPYAPQPALKVSVDTMKRPLRHTYTGKVAACQELIRAGESYELCLTDQTEVHALNDDDPSYYWRMYQRLRQLNPAPFAAYLRLGSEGKGVHILSSSPERFLSWSREGRCQLRPIKGTVKKTAGVDLAAAQEILGSSKERAENLMIVDLIRHDLYGVLGAGNVHVKQLMVVEEYETVFQLVSVIEGDLNGLAFGQSRFVREDSPMRLSPSSPFVQCEMDELADFDSRSRQASKQGIQVLAASLPPGSMTGAPKKRSCQLLQSIEEDKPRGIYSGVIGYLDVGGGGDFSVVIRTAVKWDDESYSKTVDGEQKRFDIWRVGAGGAVTAQSTPEGEFDEMMTKQESTVRLFGLME